MTKNLRIGNSQVNLMIIGGNIGSLDAYHFKVRKIIKKNFKQKPYKENNL